MNKENPLLMLCYRIHEPIFFPKGENGQCKFNIPTSFWIEKYRSIFLEILEFSTKLFINPFDSIGSIGQHIQQIDIEDFVRSGLTFNLNFALKIDRGVNFSTLRKDHRNSANELCKIFFEANNVKQLLSAGAYCRDRVNPQMFVYCMQICMLHRPDCKHIPLMKLWEIFPDKFLDSALINKCRDEVNIVPVNGRRVVEIPPDWTANEKEPEQKLAYFREDIGINIHHWHWHLVYPAFGLQEFVDKPRRGELNYYMHHQILARYNTERYCNNMPRTRPISISEPIAEGYFPKLSEANSGRNWPSRPANMQISDVNRPKDETVISIEEMEEFERRILEAINTMSVKNEDGSITELDERDGINTLVNLIEATSLSVNLDYYGDYHNMGHNMMAFVHDPDNRFLEENGCMGDQATAMRDPVFYRWHTRMDQIFTLLKDKLPPYSVNKLSFRGITVKSASIIDPKNEQLTNTIETHWVDSDIKLSSGLAFTQRGPITARVQHLDHKAFKYRFIVHNANHGPVRATVRIFMAPKYDETGKPLSLNDQRMHMIEMDKLIYTLQVGENRVDVYSYNSSVTVPWETTFESTDTTGPLELDPTTPQYNAYKTCGCGWPLHMLVPKGTTSGFSMDLFVMFSNYEEDKTRLTGNPDPTACNMGVSYCGLRNQPWPEVQSMGYPFDRVTRPGVKTMKDFLTPNMMIQPITIYFRAKAQTLQSGRPKEPNGKPSKPCKPFDLLCSVLP